MKRYRFPLRSVTVVRTHQENRARDSFASSIHALVQAEGDLVRARSRRDDFALLLRTGRNATFSPAAEAQSLAAYRQESAIAAEAERVMLAARATMEKARADYLEAHRKLEVVEKLEVRSRAAHRLEVNRQEQAEFDDFSGGRASRQGLSRT
jgi:flagellar export protein FliJ